MTKMVLVLDRQRTDQKSTWPAVFIMAMLNDGNHSGLGWLGTHTGWVLKEGEGLGFRGPRTEQEESHPGPQPSLSHT